MFFIECCNCFCRYQGNIAVHNKNMFMVPQIFGDAQCVTSAFLFFLYNKVNTVAMFCYDNIFYYFLLVANNVTGNTQGSTNYTGFGLNYAKGPLVINYANQSYDGAFVGGKQVATASTKTNVFAINYNVGAANLYGGWVSSDYGTSSETGYTVGVKVPMGKNSVSVGYASNKATVAGVDKTIGAWGAPFIQGVTKSTVAYYGLQSVDSNNKYSAGLRVNF